MQLTWSDRIELSEVGVERVNKVSGVYKLIYHDTVEDKYYVHYVGQTSDLNARLESHLPGNEVNSDCNKILNYYDCFFRVAGVPKQSDRDGVEAALHDHYKPKCCKRSPDVVPIEVNFN